MTIKIYLCGAINGCSDDEANGWRASVKSVLTFGYELIDPMSRDYRGIELIDDNAKEIVENDLIDIKNSDIILYYYDKPSVGSAMEVFYAYRVLHKPVIVVNPKNQKLSPWLVYHSTRVVDTLNEALCFIEILEDNI